jgi:hypothetical protein
MASRSFAKWLLVFSMVLLPFTVPAREGESSQSSLPRLAALALPTGTRADWQQWDSFLTNVVKNLSENFQPALRDQLGEFFLDSRYRLVDALGGRDFRSGATAVYRLVEPALAPFEKSCR